MRILVTGGCGFIGSVLVPKLLAGGHEVSVVDVQWFGNRLEPHERLTVIRADVRDLTAANLQGFNAIVHLANIANDPSVELNPVLSWEVNVLAAQQLADAAVRMGVTQFVFASSGSVYGVKSEERVTEDLPLIPISTYNKTKMVAERVLLSYSVDMAVHCIRPATVCGVSPRMRFDVAVNMLTLQALEKGEITVLGGEQTRPNIHIEDITDVFIHFLNNPRIASGCYNAGFENLTIREIAEFISGRTGASVTIASSNDPRSYRQYSGKLLDTGFSPTHSVAEAVDDIVRLYRAGSLSDSPEAHTVSWMTGLGLG